jgi:hypothetical protein
MIKNPKVLRLVKALGWVAVVVTWSALVVFKVRGWRQGDISLASLLTSCGTATMIVFFSAIVPLIEARLSTRPKPPLVYRSTILD